MMENAIAALKRDIKTSIRFSEWTLRWRKHQFFNESLISIFNKNVEKMPEKVAINFKDQIWSFKDLDLFSNQIANAFTSLGLKAGDEVALILNNCPQYVGIWLGSAKVGIITAFINVNNRCDSLIDCFNAFKCKAIIYGQEFTSALEEIQDRLSEKYPSMKYICWTNEDKSALIETSLPSQSLREVMLDCSQTDLDVRHKRNFDDTLVYVFTSGTTGGKCKAAIETDARVIIGAMGHSVGIRFRKDDNFYISLPLYHIFGGVLAVGHCLVNGNTITIAEKFSATNYWKDCIRYKCTVGLYIGEICRYLLLQAPKPEDTLHSVRMMYGLGLRGEYWTQFKTRFAIKHIFEFYGASETNVYVVNLDDKEGSCGFIPYYYGPFLRIIYSGMIIKVDPDTLEPVRNRKGICKRIKPGETGVIVGRHNRKTPLEEFKGYTDPTETEKKRVYNVISKGDSGFMSGDLLEMDRYGYLFFKDRTGDTFRWKGENVSTTDVEAVLQSCLGLRDCLVFGVSVGQCEGKAGMAVICGNSSIDWTQLSEQVVRRLPSYAIPLFIRISESVETTNTYKLIKYKLKSDSFNPNSCSDRIYFFDKQVNQYIPLDHNLYNKIQSGEVRL